MKDLKRRKENGEGRLLTALTLILISSSLIMFAVFVPSFLSFFNLVNIANQNYYVIVMACGLAFVMYSGGIDLSIGYQVSLVSAVSGIMIAAEIPPFLILLCALLTGIGCGILNGVFVTLFRIPPIIATVATQLIYQGLSYLLTDGKGVTGIPELLMAITKKEFLFQTIDCWLTILCILLVVAVFTFMYFGRHILAVGEREETAATIGIKVNHVKMVCYMTSGFLNAVAAMILLSRQGVASSASGIGIEWTVITALYFGAVLIGNKKNSGIRLALSLVLGVYLLALFENGMQMAGWNQYIQYLIRGVILAGSVAVNRYRDKEERIGSRHF